MSEQDFPTYMAAWANLLAGSALLSLSAFNSTDDGLCWMLGICRVSSEMHCITLGGSDALQPDELWEMATVVAVTSVLYYNMLQGGLQMYESIS